jgi:mevalonate pyrophosphate decarboxylase
MRFRRGDGEHQERETPGITQPSMTRLNVEALALALFASAMLQSDSSTVEMVARAISGPSGSSVSVAAPGGITAHPDGGSGRLPRPVTTARTEACRQAQTIQVLLRASRRARTSRGWPWCTRQVTLTRDAWTRRSVT